MAKTEPFHDGAFHIATCSSEILRDLFCAMHGVPTPDGQVPSEHALRLYNSVSDELVARIALDAKARADKPELPYYHDDLKWLILFPGMLATPEPIIVDGSFAEANSFANNQAVKIEAPSYIVLPYIIAMEGKR